MILDRFVEKHKLEFRDGKGDYLIAEGELKGSPFLLVKPVTYVNLSGMAALQIVDEYSIDVEDILVVVDDLNLREGDVRIRGRGGDGGHNGLSSIIEFLETNSFPRLRFGIGSDFLNGMMPDYVLSKVPDDVMKVMDDGFTTAINSIEHFFTGGLKGMLEYFSKRTQELTLNSGNQISG